MATELTVIGRFLSTEATIDLIPGTEVLARDLRWEVVLSQPMGSHTMLRLRGLEGVFLGRELDLLHPFETVQPVTRDLEPSRAAPLPNWLVYHQAFLLEQALGHDAILATQPGRLRLEPYQLVPVLRAIRMGRPRLLLADGVGLGKTVQTGLILTELMARRIAHRILVVSPAGPLLEQWRTELLERFGLRVTVIDRATLDDVRRSNELGANPFDHIPLGLASMDFLKQESVIDLLDRATYDVVVIDEAHHCMDVGANGEREDSLRRRMAEVLARRCDSLILATATPHDGNDRSFASLCELLDYSLVDGRGTLRGERFRAHVVRRLKDHIKDPATGEPKFRKRVVLAVPVTAAGDNHAPFRELQRELVALLSPELRRALRARRYEDVLSFISLLKRSVSSVAACRSTLQVVADRFEQLAAVGEEAQESRRQRLRTLRDYNRRVARFGALTPDEEADRESVEAEDLAQSLAAMQRELRAGRLQLAHAQTLGEGLARLLHLADAALAADPKLVEVASVVAAIRAQEPESNILVYTEYVATQRALIKHLAGSVTGDVLALSGNDDDAARGTTTQRFRHEGRLVLVSTDAAAEGLNLHQRCHHLVHVELPFNPNRLEQRNGRIDRYGQTHDPIVRYLYLARSFEERILLRLIAKYERQRARLTFVPNTLGNVTSSEAATARLLQGLAEEEGWLFKDDPAGPRFTVGSDDENQGADTATLELLEEIDRCLKGFNQTAKTHAWLAEAGLQAEPAQVVQADEAITRGRREGAVDLAAFVADAVRLDGGTVTGSIADSLFAIRPPATWGGGFEEMPGFDPATRCLHLTSCIDVERTPEGSPVAFIGRSHPLVRRALDRVRHLTYGGEAARGLDIRVSAVQADVPAPELLLTYLARVTSRAGREYERVVAVRARPPGDLAFLVDTADWAALADRARAIATGGVWDRHFADTWSDTLDRAQAVALKGFTPLAETFRCERHRELTQEETDLNRWLAQRAEEITGADQVDALQLELPALAPAPASTPAWRTLGNPQERLAAFVSDRSRTPSSRSEAEGVLRLYGQRSEALRAALSLADPEVVPLGMLMLVPHA